MDGELNRTELAEMQSDFAGSKRMMPRNVEAETKKWHHPFLYGALIIKGFTYDTSTLFRNPYFFVVVLKMG